MLGSQFSSECTILLPVRRYSALLGGRRGRAGQAGRVSTAAGRTASVVLMASAAASQQAHRPQHDCTKQSVHCKVSGAAAWPVTAAMKLAHLLVKKINGGETLQAPPESPPAAAAQSLARGVGRRGCR